MTPRSGNRVRMFVRMLARAALVRPGHVVSAVLAVVVAAAVATAMLNLYVDVQAKLQNEFRGYGANIVVTAKAANGTPGDLVARVRKTLAPGDAAVPFGFVVARAENGSPIVVAGTDLKQARELNSWWSVSAPTAPTQHDSATKGLVGVRALAALSPEGKPFDLTFRGRTLRISVAGVIRTGAQEESRIYVPMVDFRAWTGLSPSTVEVAAQGSPRDISAAVQKLSAALPEADVKPVRQVVEGEARVLGKTEKALAASSSVIVLTAALCVLATLTTWVLDRRKDFAVMKALGASDRAVNGFFAAQATAIGAVGACIGYAIGIGVATWIGRANFHAAISPRLSVLPGIVAGSVALALIAAVIPITLLQRVQPATILRGE